jgi:mono/diheme cytochrome c family protein
MNSEPKNTLTADNPALGDDAESTNLLVLFLIIIGVLLYLSGCYLEWRGGAFSLRVYPPFTSEKDLASIRPPDPNAKGKRVYRMTCEPCHQPTGLGMPGQFPPLVKSDWVLAPGPNRMIRIVLNGLQGPVQVLGADFNNVMVPWRDNLKDDEIAAVISFVRGNKAWGNDASPVTPEQVKAIRDQTASKGGVQWTADELKNVPDSDPPK